MTKKKTTPKKKMGAPTKFSKKLMPTLEKLFKKGFTDKEVAEILNVKEQTLNNWKKKHPDFFESLKGWKHYADLKVEEALYERATGYEHPEEKVFNNNGEIIVHEGVKKYPPDYSSMALWLKNRKPKEWRDKIEHEHKNDPDNPIEFNFVVNQKKIKD